VVFDNFYSNNWVNLKGIRIQGIAEVLWEGEEYKHADELLRSKYPEYRTKEGIWKEDEVPIIKITPQSIGKWANGEWAK
jgi:hypothetical protein